MNHIPAYTEIP